MAKKKDDRYKGCFNEAAEPKSKGGRRSRHPIHPVRQASLTNLTAGRNKSWTPGCASPNPTGRPKKHQESVDYLRGYDDEINGYIVELARKGAEGKLTNSDKIWSQHLWAMKEYMFGRNPQAIVVGGGLAIGDAASSVDGSGLNALLLRARYEQVKKIEARPGVFVAEGNVAAPLPAPDPDPTNVTESVTNVTPDPETAGANPPASGGNPLPKPAVGNATESVAMRY